jgi:chromosome segregation protein
VEAWSADLEALQKTETEKSEQVTSLDMQYQSLSQKEDFIAENIGRLSYEIGQNRETLLQLADSMGEGKKEIEEKSAIIEEMQTAIRKVQEGQAHFSRELSGATEERERVSREQERFVKERESLAERKNLLDKECFKLSGQREKLEEGSEQRTAYLWEEYQMTPELAKEYKNSAYSDMGALKKELAALKEEIRGLGNVNVNAIEEYKEVSERFAFMDGQRKDLADAEEALLKIISELEEGMRRQFDEKFRAIQQEFDKVFKELFGGGRGRLMLMDEEDMLETGIQIHAQPPGKKLDNMMMLSGGEKALTAIALLFAIQNLKPSPFCLLDEIEAALDESNVERFAKYLNKLTKNTQFIVITHRRGTMAEADQLYGITMQEKGISTLVSVNLIEDQLEETEKKNALQAES